jgi:L-seryl-tRNA(Ser) seleniumtransferase
VDAVLQHHAVKSLCDVMGRSRVGTWARKELDDVRTRLAAPSISDPNGCGVTAGAAFATGRDAILDEVIRRLTHRADDESRRRLSHVINGSGVILHTNLGRAPLAAAALDAVDAAARYTNLELDLVAGRRGQRGTPVEQLWRELTGAEAALIVNNCAAATFLTLNTIAGPAGRTSESADLVAMENSAGLEVRPTPTSGREVILSRGQLIEIGGSYRLHDVFAASGALLREVGTTNRTRLADYESAINASTVALLRVHASNYRISGFTESVPITALADLAHAHGLVAIDDLGSGCLYDLAPYGLTGEPVVVDSLAAGADLVLFSGDKLLGGPQCGVILGRREMIDRLRTNPLARALRVDKLTLAALQATLEIHLAGTAFTDIPALRMLAESPEAVRTRAARLASSIAGTPERPAAHHWDVVGTDATIGGGSLPGQTLPSYALRLVTGSPDELAARLRTGRPAILPRIEDCAVLIDVRTVLPDEEPQMIQRLQTLFADR